MNEFFYKLECYLKKKISRGGFLKIVFSALLFMIANNALLKWAFANAGESTGRPKKGIKGDHDIVVAEGKDPYQNTVKAIEAMGGMGRFVKTGDVVVVKPNMAWDRNPEQAANTNPAVVAAIVELCYKAGAKRVNVFDVPCNEERRVHENCGIAKAARDKGANVFFVDHWNVLKAKYSYPASMQDWPILRDAVACDTFINVPVLKHHSLAGLTLSMKNLMGVCSGKRGIMHMDMDRKLVDLTGFINPDLTVIDATRHLKRNGPSGGNLEDVVELNKLVVATDPTLADAYAASLAGKDPMDLGVVREAVKRNFGSADIAAAKILKLAL